MTAATKPLLLHEEDIANNNAAARELISHGTEEVENKARMIISIAANDVKAYKLSVQKEDMNILAGLKQNKTAEIIRKNYKKFRKKDEI